MTDHDEDVNCGHDNAGGRDATLVASFGKQRRDQDSRHIELVRAVLDGSITPAQASAHDDPTGAIGAAVSLRDRLTKAEDLLQHGDTASLRATNHRVNRILLGKPDPSPNEPDHSGVNLVQLAVMVGEKLAKANEDAAKRKADMQMRMFEVGLEWARYCELLSGILNGECKDDPDRMRTKDDDLTQLAFLIRDRLDAMHYRMAK